MRIAGVATSYPAHYYPQQVILGALHEYWRGKVENPRLLDQLHLHAGVDGRHLAMPLENYYGLETFGQANRIFIEVAQDLGAKAIICALERAGVLKDRVGAFFFVSVTGVASPSIDALLMNRLKLPTGIRRTPIFGLGCVAGAAGISRAADYVRAYPDQVALLLSVELCSLTLQKEDLTVANLISSGLFGDGAAAVVVAGKDVPVKGPQILGTRSVFYPETQDVMGWDISERGFRIVLSREVPDVVREHLGQDTDILLAQHNLKRSDIGSWVLHTGGPKVLEATQDSLGLHSNELAASWDCLRRTGNLSSASVLAVLEEVTMNRRPAPGTLGVLAAMGPGFCSEAVLFRW